MIGDDVITRGRLVFFLDLPETQLPLPTNESVSCITR